MKRLFLLILISLILLGTLSVNCFAGKDERVLAYVPKALLSPPWVATLEGAKAEAEKRGWTFKYLAPPNETASDVQMTLIEDFILQEVDAILAGPCDDEAIGEAVKKSNEANIPIALINTEQEFTYDVLAYSISDEIFGGETIGKFCVEKLKDRESKNVVIIEGVPGHFCNRKRLEGFFNIIKDHPEITILTQQPANWERAQGMSVMENLLTAYPNIDFVYVLNDEGAMGAMQAIKAAGKTDDIYITGYDGNVDALEAVRDGDLSATIYLDWAETGRLAAEMAINFVENGTKPEKLINRIPVKLVTKENVSDFLKK